MNFSMDMQCAVEENAEGFDRVKECDCIMKISTRLPVDLSDEASQAAAGGREEGCADSSSVATLYTLLCRPPALWTSLVVTDDFSMFNEIAAPSLTIMTMQYGC